MQTGYYLSIFKHRVRKQVLLATCFHILEPVTEIHKIFHGSDSHPLFVAVCFHTPRRQFQAGHWILCHCEKKLGSFQNLLKSLPTLSVERLIPESSNILLLFAFFFSPLHPPLQKNGKKILKCRSHLWRCFCSLPYSPNTSIPVMATSLTNVPCH